LGITVPHRAADLFTMGTKVTYAGLQPGDLVFFITGGDGVSHVGIYIGNDHFIHASSKYGVKEQKIAGYYAEHLCGARRVIK
jgi:cell wall-associated NlpC family hydrolase